jgi:hypothetical protein
MYFPNEILNLIFSYRGIHPTAVLMKPYINHIEAGNWYFDYEYEYFHNWYFAEHNRNSYSHFKLNNHVILYDNKYSIHKDKWNTYSINKESYNSIIKTNYYKPYIFGNDDIYVKKIINSIHHINI